ncbi:ferrous iron transport protein B [Oceanidesulfovibrio marinus]|uniref:Ferrous iron transport protein B n=1 Tax=Oceanidesulfovibrio marinus TaxID=370038 RepID=A0A6P1ZBN0_9BACT|nr:ferrous iron transport protein B [Oceanidesulfovibrio marinus]TVM31407.1 ferrous iron transport protein B [Oceanidesulfovibrio marinus]
MSSKRTILVGLAGQQNSGKSTIFNMLTGANQHIANYPGVTVDKKVGSYRDSAGRVEVVDLPGTYSLTSFSLEERVTRDFLRNEKPDAVVNVLDTSQLKRSLYLTFQLLEMGMPLVLACNMVDVAEARGMALDANVLSSALGVPVVTTVGRKGAGKADLRDVIRATASRESGAEAPRTVVAYDELEPHIAAVEKRLNEASGLALIVPPRWLALKLLEGDSEAAGILEASHSDAAGVLTLVRSLATSFEEEMDISPADHIVSCRDELASQIVAACMTQEKSKRASLSEKVDRFVLNRALAPFVLVLSVYCIYELSIVQGYELTKFTWPALAWLRETVASLLPFPGLLEDSLLRSLVLWMVDSANTLLNYVPIFFILFALIAILEDSGYMARIAFILDRIFHSFGLHGQSTLPFILGGVFAGGCAVPGVMATKGIPDERSRLATILTVPYMNCLAKVPLYTLLVNIYFAAHKSWAMLFISTITIIMALIIAKFLTSVVLRGKETAPFVMEMPTYHLPTVLGVLRRSVDRTWQYIKKVGTIVVAVSVCVFFLLQFPGVPEEHMADYRGRIDEAMTEFRADVAALGETPYLQLVQGEGLEDLVIVYDEYRAARLGGGSNVNEEFEATYPEFYPLIARSGDAAAKKINRMLRGLSNTRKTIRREIRSEQIANSFFGRLGRLLEPVTHFAGFDWKVNIALISSFAARESSVATLGAIFQEGADEGATLEQRMASESNSEGRTPLGALALIIFFALYPPCLATTIMVKVQTGSYKWMLFSIMFPTVLGLAVSSVVFTGGSVLGLSGVEAMGVFYGAALILAVALAFVPDPAWNAPKTTYVEQS